MPLQVPAYSDKLTSLIVRLGKSGLKISKIILGCMSYGSHGWNEWVIDDQEEVTRHIKVAYVLQISGCLALAKINAFTAMTLAFKPLILPM